MPICCAHFFTLSPSQIGQRWSFQPLVYILTQYWMILVFRDNRKLPIGLKGMATLLNLTNWLVLCFVYINNFHYLINIKCQKKLQANLRKQKKTLGYIV